MEHALFDFINARTLAHMKPDALIINVSRGPLIDEPALIQALKEQQLVKRLALDENRLCWSTESAPYPKQAVSFHIFETACFIFVS